MSKDTKEAALAFSILTAVLYAICAFSQLDLDVTNWTTVARAIFGVGIVLIIIYLVFVFNQD